MSNASIDEIQELIQKLSGELGEMSEAASRHIDDLHVAVNNVASHVLAIEAILALVAQKVEIDDAAAIQWIRDKTAAYAEDGNEGSAAEGIAQSLLGKEES
ncbi:MULTISPECIES: hypothetical protein [Thalassospira]|uniref:Uncharacterized protein n=1 Tax=Thalassospira povalilytica TaxID=732237 RepID=A0A8I1SID6_9PROT|nr:MULTISPECIES: hypothetical protein [Thalassospira]MEE3047116.1 hypothetical protein [Pseudomonadota bacterium]RCK26549.1 hypothetical protein TH8_07430 [Thalassospira profundimaris]MBN8195699.1 hypothetical protein [Thalassospira povalilytica]MBO6769960.1 hypothetical protein [Thalassospira sp.]MCC4239495.1 hypothetical protein [Thalassospira povalilytica]